MDKKKEDYKVKEEDIIKMIVFLKKEIIIKNDEKIKK